jgi:hypothetical protein
MLEGFDFTDDLEAPLFLINVAPRNDTGVDPISLFFTGRKIPSLTVVEILASVLELAHVTATFQHQHFNEVYRI